MSEQPTTTMNNISNAMPVPRIEWVSEEYRLEFEARKVARKKVCHNYTGTRIYKVWVSMIHRCESPKSNNWQYYGARGIKVCDRWKEAGGQGFINFLEDMGEPPCEGLSIDRINNDGNYEPNNCRWATASQQAQNRRSRRLLTYKGKTASIKEWAEITGISTNTINQRLHKGWSDEKTLSTPVKKIFVQYEGKIYQLKELAQKLNVSPITICERIRKGSTDIKLADDSHIPSGFNIA